MPKALAEYLILLFGIYYPVDGCLRIGSRPISRVTDGRFNLTTKLPSQLIFTRLQLRSPMNSSETCNDTLQVSIPNNSTNRSTVLGSFYGNEITKFQFPYSTQFMVHLDLGNCTATLNDTYIEFYFTECGSLYTEDSGFIYPQTNLTESMVCVDRVSVTNGDSILLLLLDSVYRPADEVEFLRCSGHLAVFSNGSYSQGLCVTGSVYIGRIPGQDLLIQYGITNASYVGETELPFTIFYTACGVTYREATGRLESPMYPYSHRGQYNCSYIVSPTGSSSISFQLNTILNGDCSKNSIVVRRGISRTGELLLYLCDTTTDHMFSNNGPVWIEFIKADNFTISSFSLTYAENDGELVGEEEPIIGSGDSSSNLTLYLIVVIAILVVCCVSLTASVVYLIHQRKTKATIKSTKAPDQSDTANDRYESLERRTQTQELGELYTSLDPATNTENTRARVKTTKTPARSETVKDRYESLQMRQEPNSGELYTPLQKLGPGSSKSDQLNHKADEEERKVYVIGARPDYRVDGTMYENP